MISRIKKVHKRIIIMDKEIMKLILFFNFNINKYLDTHYTKMMLNIKNLKLIPMFKMLKYKQIYQVNI